MPIANSLPPTIVKPRSMADEHNAGQFGMYLALNR
jgi:hypothetical protein